MNASTIASRLIGDIFVEEGLITEDQLEQALEEQLSTGERLGEILVARFGVSRLDLSSALLVQLADHETSATTEGEDASGKRDLEALVSEWSAPDVGPVEPPLTGQILVEDGTVSEEQLREAIHVQRTTGRRLGEILVDQGLLSPVQLTSAVSQQLAGLQTQSPPFPRPDETPGFTSPADDELATVRSEGLPVHGVRGTATDSDVAALAERLEELKARFSELVDAQRGDGAQRPEVAHDLRAAVERMQERFERAESAAGERLAHVELQLADSVTPAQLTERVHSLTSGMSKLGRLCEDLASRLSLLQTRGIDTVAGEVKELRAQLADHGHEELVGVVDRVAELELRLSAAATSAELDERLERALAAHVDELGSGLDALAHSMKQVASSDDLNRLRRTVDLLSEATEDANAVAVRRLQQLEARAQEAAAVDERLEAALIATADKAAAADERLRQSLVDVMEQTERSLAEQSTELHARLGGDVQKLQLAAAENLSSLRVSIEGLATQLAEQRRRLEAQVRTDVERLDGRIEQQEASADEHAAGAARATELLEQEMQRLVSELRSGLGRHADRIDEQRRGLEEVRDAGQQALQAAAAGLAQRLADVEQRAATSAVGLKADLGELGEKVAGQAVEAARKSAAARAELERLRTRVDDLTGKLEGHEHRAVEDTANAQRELDEIRSGLGALGSRLDDFGDVTTQHLDAVRQDLGKFHIHVEQLSLRLRDETARAADATTAVMGDLEGLRESLAKREAAADERLRSLVQSASARTDEKIDLLAERSAVDALRGRVDEHEKLIADSRLRQHEASTEFGQRLGRLGEELQKSFSRIESGRQEASAELDVASASLREEQQELAAALRAEHDRSVSSLREEIGEHERRALAELSEHRTSLGETTTELAELRRDVVESARERRQSDEALDARVDETRGEIAMVLKKVAECERELHKGDDLLGARIDALGRQLASESTRAAEAAVAEREALRGGLELITRRLDHVDQRSQRAEERVNAAVDHIESGPAGFGTRSDSGTAGSQLDLRAELTRTAESQAVLLSRVDELSRSQEVRLAGAEEALQSLGVDELRAQVVALQSQIRAQADAAEQLQRRFAEIDSNLHERGRKLREGPEKADRPLAYVQEESNEESAAKKQTYLAFTPDNDNRYTMIECSGEQPAVGETIELAELGGGALVVTRVTHSPLPHDTRPCIYLERAS